MNDTIANLSYGQKLYPAVIRYCPRTRQSETFLFRATPVPGIHKPSTGSYFALPRHIYQWRDYARVHELEHELIGYRKCLHKKSFKKLVDPRDDKPKSCWKNQNWKNFRCTRYRRVEASK